MPNPIAERHWAIAMAETVCIEGCTCTFCSRRSDADAQANRTHITLRSRRRGHARRSLPSTSSVMEVLYPLSYSITLPTLPDPPLYYAGVTRPSTIQGNNRRRMESAAPISPTPTTAVCETLASYGLHGPLVDVPSLTGVPSPGAPSGRALPGEPNAPAVGLGIDIVDEADPPPPYSRFDESRSRLSINSGLLGPYPHITVFNHLRDEGRNGSLEATKGGRSPAA